MCLSAFPTMMPARIQQALPAGNRTGSNVDHPVESVSHRRLVRRLLQAARDMAISQSTLSQHVRELEADCGQNLLDRKARGVSLSAHGERLFEITSRLFQAEKEANAFLRGEAGVNGGHLRVAADGPILALPILSRLKIDRPKLTFPLPSTTPPVSSTRSSTIAPMWRSRRRSPTIRACTACTS